MQELLPSLHHFQPGVGEGWGGVGPKKPWGHLPTPRRSCHDSPIMVPGGGPGWPGGRLRLQCSGGVRFCASDLQWQAGMRARGPWLWAQTFSTMGRSGQTCTSTGPGHDAQSNPWHWQEMWHTLTVFSAYTPPLSGHPSWAQSGWVLPPSQ